MKEKKPIEYQCSLIKTCKTLIETDSGKFCSCCYEICKGGADQPKLLNVIFETFEGCECLHEG